MNARLGAALVACALLSVPNSAWAFVCSRAGDSEGPALTWFSRESVYTFFDGGTGDVNGDEEFDVLRDSFAVWEALVTGPTLSCTPAAATTDFNWIENPVRSTIDRIGYNFIDPANNENLVIFRDERWPYPGREDRDLALATVTFNRVTGEILDSDVEFNTANNQFTVGDFNPVYDLMNTAVHEIGHLMGLAHTPDTNATMFGSAVPREIKKRDLNCDDYQAAAFKYPSSAPNGYCEAEIGPACGFCAPPGEVEQQIEAIQVAAGSDVGGCAASSATGWLWLLALIRRRRAF